MSKNIAHHSVRWSFILIFVSLVFIAFFTGFARLGLPYVSNYRAEIQNNVSAFLGKTVEIGSLDISWRQFGPRLVLHDLVLDSGADASQNVALKKIYLDLDLLRSWLNGSWQINEVSIVGAKLLFEYYGDQKIRVYGENLDGSATVARSSESLDVLSWLMQADRVGLLESSVTLRDGTKDISVEVQDLNIRVSNQDGLHKIRVDLKAPSLSENPVALNLDFTGDRKDLINSAGVFNLSMSELDLGKTTDLLSDFLPLSVIGNSDLALWGEWSNGEIDSFRIQSTLGQSEWLNKKTLAALSVPASSADWLMVKNADEYRLALNSLRINNLDENLSFLLRVKPKEQKRWWLNAQGEALELASMTPVMRLFEGIGDNQLLTKNSLLDTLRGDLKDWHIQAKGQQGQFPSFSADAELNNISLGNDAELPGFEGLNAQLSMRENNGLLLIDDDQVSINLPKWFNSTHNLSKLQTNLGFRIDRGRFVVQSDKVIAQSEGQSAIARLKIQKNIGFDPYIDVEAEASDMSFASARQYFPEKIMKPKLLNWFDSAILAGDISDLRMAVKGSSRGFPYANGKGVFKADVSFHNGTVKAIKNWPHVDVTAAKAEFRQNAVNVSVSSANTDGNALSKVELSVADLKQPVIKLQGQAQSKMAAALSYIDKTPLKSPLEPLVKSANGTGEFAVDLDLTLPLYKNSPAISYVGKIVFQENDWSSKALSLDLQDIKGTLRFTEKNLTSEGLKARAFNTPVTISASADENNPRLFSRVTATGNIATSSVLENYDLPISHWFDGSSPWKLQLDLKRDVDSKQAMQVSMLAKSELLGTSVDLPAPYGKDKNKKGQLSANIYLDENSKNPRWNFSYADHLRARVETKPNEGGLKALTVRINEPLPAIAKSFDGVNIKGRVSALVLDEWASSITDVIARLEKSPERTPIMPVQGNIVVDSLLIGQVDSGAANVAFTTDSENISTRIESKWLVGDLDYPRQHWLKEKPLKSRLSLLDKQFLDAFTTTEGDSESRIDPRDFPPMELAIDQFVWDQYSIADLRLRTIPVADGMKTEALGFIHSDLQMSGEAYWRMLDPQNIAPEHEFKHRTDISFSLKSDDVGAGMDGLGVLGAFSGGQGQVDVRLAWNDAAYAPDLMQITGSIKPQLKNGHILAVEPGAAKILGLFALQAVPRRLLLDFNDMTREGMLYDDISGDVVIANGIATTKYMQLTGPIGVVSSNGVTDFVHLTYDQKIVVLPRISSVLPIIGLLSAGATAGVGVLVADQLLKGVGVNFDEVGKREYHLTGSWDDPQIRHVYVPKKETPQSDNR